MTKHFFQRDSTYEHLENLSTSGEWTVYVGLGGTIDRTDVTWERLVRSLIERYETQLNVTKSEIAEWVSSLGPQRAATTAETLYRDNEGGAWITELQREIARTLYGPRRAMQGMLLDALSEWAITNAALQGSTVLVTPNYDSYLYDVLATHSIDIEADDKVALRRLMVLGDRFRLPPSWTKPGSVACLHVHGYVPARGEARGVPVVGEVTYGERSAITTRALRSLFQGRRTLVLGSSLNDGPLVESLRTSSSPYRAVVLPYQGVEWRNDSIDPGEAVNQLHNARLRALGLTSIQPDYFGQSAQLMSDASYAMLEQGRESLRLETTKHRSDSKLERWWSKWRRNINSTAAQSAHHEIVRLTLPTVRRAVGAKPGEVLKIEVWSRWKPNTERKLALWASSIGPWRDTDAIRKDEISLTSKYRAVQIFCYGSPRLFEDAANPDSRWRSYFGVPIWGYTANGRLLLGVAIVASTWQADISDPVVRQRQNGNPSSLRGSNMVAAWRVVTALEYAGNLILDEPRGRKPYEKALLEMSSYASILSS